jgi:hypothetical protein
LSELIAERAYEVYQRRVRNGAPGDQHSDWAQAEKEVTEELKKKDAAKPKAPEAKPVPVSAPKAEVKPVAKPEVKEPPKPEVKAAPPKVEPKPATAAAPAAPVSTVKTVVAKKAVKK